jgi:hypothetical protein
MSYLPNLRHLNLPSNLASTRDFALIRAPLCSINHHASSSYTISMMPPPKSLISARRLALCRDGGAERCVVDRLFNSRGAAAEGKKKKNLKIGRLSSVSFVRQVHSEDRLEYAVAYSRVPRGCDDSDGDHDHDDYTDADGTGMTNVQVRVVRPSGGEVNVPIATAVEMAMPVMGPEAPLPIPTPSASVTSDMLGTGTNTYAGTDEEMLSLCDPMCPANTPWSAFARAARAQVHDDATTTSIMAMTVDSLLYGNLDFDLDLELDSELDLELE